MSEPLDTLGPLKFKRHDGPRRIFEEISGVGRVIVTVVENDVIRVQVQPYGRAYVARTWAIVGRAGDAPREGRDREDLSVFSCPATTVVESAGYVVIATERVTLRVNLDPPALSWSLPDGAPLLSDHPELAYRHATPGPHARGAVADSAPPRGVRHTLTRDLDEIYLGLGEVSGELDRHHRRYRLLPKDALGYEAQFSDPLYKHMPVYTTLTPAGHAVGLLYDAQSSAVFDFGSEVDNYIGKFRYAEFAARELDYYVLIGPDLPTVVKLIQDLTGYAPTPPDWSLGYMGSTMAYTDAEDPAAALAGFVEKLREYRMPCTAFHLSSGYSMGDDGNRYVFSWNRRRVPQPRRMVEALEAAGIRTLANIKPALLKTHPAYEELAASGAFVREADSDRPYTSRFWGGLGSYIDFTNEIGYDWWKQQVKEQILSNGIDATWNDNNEFQIHDDEARTAAGPAGDLRPVLTLLMNMASRDAQREFMADGARSGERSARVERATQTAGQGVSQVHASAEQQFQLTRSGALGVHRYAQTWSGDNQTSWKTLQYNIPMGLGLSLSGWSNHGHDVGGFAGPPPDPELLVRWVEAGVLMPRFSIHSWNDDGSATEPWSYPEVLPLVRRLLEFRTVLTPYLKILMREAATSGVPVTRPLVYQFPQWRPGWRESFSYMLGNAFLVAPVYQPGATSREVLLPPGEWRTLRGDAELTGETTVRITAPLGTPLALARLDSGSSEAVREAVDFWR